MMVLSACSSSNEEKVNNQTKQHSFNRISKTGRIFNSCDLLSKAEIKQLFPSVTVIKITRQGDEAKEAIGTRICFYDLSPDDMKFIQTTLFRTSDLSPELIKVGRTAGKMFAINKGFVTDPVPVNGIGREAWYGGSGLKAGAGLHVLVDGNTALDVKVGLGKGNADKAAHLKIEKARAKKVISNLMKR